MMLRKRTPLRDLLSRQKLDEEEEEDGEIAVDDLYLSLKQKYPESKVKVGLKLAENWLKSHDKALKRYGKLPFGNETKDNYRKGLEGLNKKEEKG